MDVYGEPLFYGTEEPLVEVQPQMGMETPLHEYLGAPLFNGLFYLLEEVSFADCVGILLLQVSRKGAKTAPGHADIGVVDVPVYGIGTIGFRVEDSTHLLRSPPQGKEVLRGDEGQALLRYYPFPGECFL